MKITNFDNLKLVIDAFGADHVIADLERVLLQEGVSLNDNLERVVLGDESIYFISETGALTRVIIHIVDYNLSSRYAVDVKDSVNKGEYESALVLSKIHKYHIVKCSTIEKADEQGWRKDRYKMSRRTNGDFYYRFISDSIVFEERSSQKLNPCKNCLKAVNKELSTNYTIMDFDLNDFLSVSLKSNLDKTINYADDCVPNIYSNDWRRISSRYRELRNFQCEGDDCPERDLSSNSYKKYLHTHHVSMDKSNNNYSNLKSLCVYCHANQPLHENLKHTPDYKSYVKLRSL